MKYAVKAIAVLSATEKLSFSTVRNESVDFRMQV